jgi:hypothetical protein
MAFVRVGDCEIMNCWPSRSLVARCQVLLKQVVFSLHREEKTESVSYAIFHALESERQSGIAISSMNSALDVVSGGDGFDHVY